MIRGRTFQKHAARQAGSVTVLALLILAILTLIGIGALTTSTSDVRTAQNRETYERNFNRSEGAVRSAMQFLEDATDDEVRDFNDVTRDSPHLVYLHDTVNGQYMPDLNDTATWDTTNAGQVPSDPNVRFWIGQLEASKGTLDITASSNRREYVIFGRATDPATGGEVIIQVGFRRRVFQKIY